MSSINLLPKEIKEEYEISKKNRTFLNLFLSIVLLSSILFGILYTSNLYLNTRYKDAKNELAEKEQSIKKFGALEKNAKELEAKLESANKIIKQKVYISKGLNHIWYSVPPKVYLFGIKLENNASKRGEIIGSADNKKQIADFMEALEHTKAFEYVDIESTEREIDPFLKTERENFTLSFALKLKNLNEKS